jgi:hypothetical protein
LAQVITPRSAAFTAGLRVPLEDALECAASALPGVRARCTAHFACIAAVAAAPPVGSALTTTGGEVEDLVGGAAVGPGDAPVTAADLS